MPSYALERPFPWGPIPARVWQFPARGPSNPVAGRAISSVHANFCFEILGKLHAIKPCRA